MLLCEKSFGCPDLLKAFVIAQFYKSPKGKSKFARTALLYFSKQNKKNNWNRMTNKSVEVKTQSNMGC